MTDVAEDGRRRTRTSIVATGVAVLLGLLAFVADSVEGVVGQVMVALVSSAFAWGSAAFLTGRFAASPRRAAATATGVLVLATLLYYLLVVFVSRRWSGAYLDDGTSADLQGLRSIAIMTALWLIGAVVAGPTLGLLGYLVRVGGVKRAALAAGVTTGFLSGEGWHAVAVVPPWQLLAVSDPHQTEFLLGVVISNLVRIVLPLVVLAWLVTTHRLWREWPALLVATVSGGALSALLWHLLDAAENSI
ncbi:DUF6518 family protein [Micromonospora sp. NPDC049523]|uniref:DUF6518 family protein n=1 Tax=Micromonospora sp. NPDC049523 TaxID=3155921 RepID=UPI003447D667